MPVVELGRIAVRTDGKLVLGSLYPDGMLKPGMVYRLVDLGGLGDLAHVGLEEVGPSCYNKGRQEWDCPPPDANWNYSNVVTHVTVQCEYLYTEREWRSLWSPKN